ncbi:RagB/SusD family nutrient uptake outer membrane protein [Chryseobacterium sp. PTM-20240506]|uniref:RagB/SusD family nutrient uptake outer membrane protein n=1 Tax=unclassified Chryseobacterium TaxID=2593645 RepID=UPI0023594F8A|nr:MULTISPECIES: RagB/SusD family nutrient uptake outer membrane protein [unclassified Chryseobacterium]MDC8106340.1 RagB/SusD family nutrient uptake outer membrane protein [Chryseobacterium sp. B21-037]MDQ1804846.1 RagB/SusD family nutrient uptake outer membrane protein [Chryseobacterium sp. CKR4-1]
MKSIFKTTILSLAVIVSVSSCNDALDITQAGELNGESTFTNTNDLDKYLNGAVYTSLDITNNLFLSAQITDELGMGPQNSELALSAHQFYLDITNGPTSGIWLGNYTTINRANRLLVGAKGIVPAESERARYNNVVSQTRLIRAFSYFTLLSYFSTDMKDPNALGVMLIEDVPELTETKPRVANSQIFALIDADVAFAESNLTTSGDYYRITKNFLNAFKARYYLYRGMYPQAKAAAQAVLNTSGLSLTVASPPNPGNLAQNNQAHKDLNAYTSKNPYVKMWNNTDTGNPRELIFSLNRPQLQSWGNIVTLFATNASQANGSILYDMGRKTFNLYASTPGDIRRFAYIDPTAVINSNYATIDNYRALDVLVIDKYPGRATLAPDPIPTDPTREKVLSQNVLRNDIPIFRLSEMYFILAECAVEEGSFTTAATLIKNVRDARNYLGPVDLPVYSSKQQAYVDILLERRKELYLEGHRYLDLKRLGAIAGVAIDRDPTDDVKTIPVTIPINDYRMRSLPIPRAELQGNPTIQQNPGY